MLGAAFGLAAKGLVKVVGFTIRHPFWTTAGVTTAVINKDNIKGGFDAAVQHVKDEGVVQSAADLTTAVTETTSKVTGGITDAYNVVTNEGGARDQLIQDTVTNTLGLGEDAKNDGSGSLFGAIGDVLQGDFVQAVDTLAGDDGMGPGDWAKVGGLGAVLLLGAKKLFGGGSKDNEGFGWGKLLMGLTVIGGALWYFNKDNNGPSLGNDDLAKYSYKPEQPSYEPG